MTTAIIKKGTQKGALLIRNKVSLYLFESCTGVKPHLLAPEII